MTFKDIFFVVDPDQSSIREDIEKVYAKSFDSLKETFCKYKELKKRYGRISVYRIEDEYECTGYGLNVLLNHKLYQLTET